MNSLLGNLKRMKQLKLSNQQIASLDNIENDDQKIIKEVEKLNKARLKIDEILSSDRPDFEQLKKLQNVTSNLKTSLHNLASDFNGKLAGILNREQMKIVHSKADIEHETIVYPKGTCFPRDIHIPEGLFPDYVFNTEIYKRVDSAFDTRCSIKDYQYEVPYCFVVDTSFGESGGYTLEVTSSHGLKEQEVKPVILSNVYHVGFIVHFRICAEPLWGDGAWWKATFTMYGKSLYD